MLKTNTMLKITKIFLKINHVLKKICSIKFNHLMYKEYHNFHYLLARRFKKKKKSLQTIFYNIFLFFSFIISSMQFINIG